MRVFVTFVGTKVNWCFKWMFFWLDLPFFNGTGIRTKFSMTYRKANFPTLTSSSHLKIFSPGKVIALAANNSTEGLVIYGKLL